MTNNGEHNGPVAGRSGQGRLWAARFLALALGASVGCQSLQNKLAGVMPGRQKTTGDASYRDTASARRPSLGRPALDEPKPQAWDGVASAADERLAPPPLRNRADADAFDAASAPVSSQKRPRLGRPIASSQVPTGLVDALTPSVIKDQVRVALDSKSTASPLEAPAPLMAPEPLNAPPAMAAVVPATSPKPSDVPGDLPHWMDTGRSAIAGGATRLTLSDDRLASANVAGKSNAGNGARSVDDLLPPPRMLSFVNEANADNRSERLDSSLQPASLSSNVQGPVLTPQPLPQQGSILQPVPVTQTPGTSPSPMMVEPTYEEIAPGSSYIVDGRYGHPWFRPLAAPLGVFQGDLFGTNPNNVYGVSGDQPGLWDNLSVRVGAAYYDTGLQEGGGVVGLMDYTEQIGDKPWFISAGVAGADVNGEQPLSFTLGFSRLAQIDGDRVTKGLIFGINYDVYHDNEFFDTSDAVTVDQLRLLLGWAISPRADVGVWAALGTGTDNGDIETPAGRAIINGAFADRVAAYLSWDVTKRVHTMTSIGHQEGRGNFFGQFDASVRVLRNTNVFASFGLADSDQGVWDMVAGVEFLPVALARRSVSTLDDMPGQWVPERQGHGRGDGMTGSFYDPCDLCACDTGSRYRGGLANGAHRGAMRVLSPTTLRRWMNDTRPRLAANNQLVGVGAGPAVIVPPAAGVVIPPAGGTNVPPPAVIVDQNPCPPSSTGDLRPVHIHGRPVNDSAMSRYLRTLGAN